MEYTGLRRGCYEEWNMLDILKNTYQRWRKQGHSSFWQVPCYLYVRKKPTWAYKQLRYEYLFNRDEDSTAYSNKSILATNAQDQVAHTYCGCGHCIVSVWYASSGWRRLLGKRSAATDTTDWALRECHQTNNQVLSDAHHMRFSLSSLGRPLRLSEGGILASESCKGGHRLLLLF